MKPESLIRFSLLSALSTSNDPPEAAAKPFSKNRDGFVMAEGAGALVLESLEHAQARGAKILGIVQGCGEKADNFHRTRSSPDGRPIIGCMQNAFADAGISPEDIDYINAHGTSTPENDKMEYPGLAAVFGERAKSVPISSNKSMIGHTLTAAGAVEAVITLLTLQNQRIPPTINYKVPDPAIPLDVVPNVARDAKVRHAISNSFGFGGQNVWLVHEAGEPALTRCMRALSLVSDRKLEIAEVAPPPPPGAARCRSASRRSRSIISTSGAGAAWLSPSGSCRSWSAPRPRARSRPSVQASTGFKAGDPVATYGALTCGKCKACLEGRDNLCENVNGVKGFHVDGFARDSSTSGAAHGAGAEGRVAARRCLRADCVLRPCSTCCSTMRSCSRARSCSCTPAAPASARRRSRSRSLSAAR